MFRKLRMRWAMRKWATLKIIYRNGSEITVQTKKLTATGTAKLSSMEWDGMWPRPIHIGVDEIVAIFQIN